MQQTNLLNDSMLNGIAERIAVGDQQAFRLLFDHFASRLTAFALSILKSKQAATEVADDVLMKIWMQRGSLHQVENIKVYLYTATKNTALNYLSRKAHEMITLPFDHINIQLRDEQCPEHQMITEEIFQKIHSAVDELPPRCKMIFKLVREDGLKYKEVADILNLSVNTVDAQMVEAVKKISEKVKGHFSLFPRRPVKKNSIIYLVSLRSSVHKTVL